MRNPYRVQCNTRPVTLHPPYPGILPLGYGVGVLLPPSPPSPVGSRPLLSLPVSCLQSRFSARPLSLPSPCWAVLPSAPPSPRLCYCQMAEPQQGAAGCWETPELPPRLSLWGSFRPSLERFSACPLPEISADDSISPSHPFHSWPSLTSLLQLLPVSFPSPDPFPSLLSQFLLPSPFLRLGSTQPLVPYLYPRYSPLHPPFLTHLFPKSFPSPSPSQPSVFNPICSHPHSGAQAPAPFLSRSHSRPSPCFAPQCFSLLRLPPPTPPSGTPLPLFSPPPNVPLGGTPAFLAHSFLPGGRSSLYPSPSLWQSFR